MLAQRLALRQESRQASLEVHYQKVGLLFNKQIQPYRQHKNKSALNKKPGDVYIHLWLRNDIYSETVWL